MTTCSPKYGRWLAWALGTLLVLRVGILFAFPHPLFFDEAQYWHWAQELAFGYFSKPPFVSWTIAATTAICGDGEGCIRLGAPLAHTMTALAVFCTGCRLYNCRTGFWSALVFATVPAVFFSSLLISTDPFLLAFWGWALYFTVRALQTKRDERHLHWWICAGTTIGFGMLAKYAMIAFIGALVLYALISKVGRKRVFSWEALAGLVLAVLIFLPNVWWNAQNHFVSFEHTKANANLGGELFHPIKMLEFIGSQFGVFGPVLFAVLLYLAFTVKTQARRDNEAEKESCGQAEPLERGTFLFCFALLLVGIMTLEGLLSRANANWAAPSYVAGSILVTAWLLQGKRRMWLFVGAIGLHTLLGIVFYAASPVVEAFDLPLTKKTDPLKRVRGVDVWGRTITLLRQSYPERKLLFEERKILTPMLYYVLPHPFDAVKWNPYGEIHDHYDLTTTMRGKEGDDFIFITRAPTPAAIEGRFEYISLLKDLSVSLYDDTYTRPMRVYLADGFKGY